MNCAAAAARSQLHALRERRCIVTGKVRPEYALMRFAVAPDRTIVPDIAQTLPGRGIWVTAERALLEQAVSRNLFAKAAGTKVDAGDLVARTERLLAERMMADLGLARRSGQLVLGFDNVARALQSKAPPAVLVEARDGAGDGRRKLLALARAADVAVEIIDCLENRELSLALGRENVVHAALKSGRLSERLATDASRLKGFRATGKNSAGPVPAADERDT